MDQFIFYLLASAGLTLLIAYEFYYSSQMRRSLFSKGLRVRTISYLLSSLLTIYLMGHISAFARQSVTASTPVADYALLDFIGVFVVAELLNWLFHYAKHWGYLWRFHYQHHIERKYTILLTTYTHALEVLFSGFLMALILAAVGFSQSALNTYFLFYILANTYQHSHANLSLGFLDYLIVSPRYHRIHHSMSYRANYGSTLTLWDIIFRQAIFPAKDEICEDIGIKSSFEPYGFWPEMTYFLHLDDKEKSGTMISPKHNKA